ncbi:MAG: hypothetical protein D6746_14265 [Bacteroidetes bacterium]|nr:MAG: hypothetical protein D6746_14265 [Bacteroidota bacterium]
MDTTHRVLRHGATGLFVLALFTLVLLPSASAQRSFDRMDDRWWDNLEAQLTASLDAPVQAIRDQALQHIIFFSTYYPEKVDFGPASGQILGIYEHSQHEGRRTMALAALSAIGEDQSMELLRGLVRGAPDTRLRQLTRAALAHYYADSTH